MGTVDTGIAIVNLPLVDGLTVNELMEGIPTPSSLDELLKNYPHAAVMDKIDRAFIVEAMRWGGVYGYRQEQNGARIQNLFPIQKHQNEQISSSSSVTLEMHTETAFHPYRPDYLALLCLRDDPNAGTTHSFLDDILPLLSDSTKSELRKKQFSTSLDESFRISGMQDREIVTPILINDDQRIIFDRALMRGLNDTATDALETLIERVQMVSKVTYLKAGQILAINNHKIVHGRTPFAPRYDGTDRWLKRALIRISAPPPSEMSSNAERNIIQTKF